MLFPQSKYDAGIWGERSALNALLHLMLLESRACRRALSFSLVLIAPAIIAACGGGGSGGSTASASSSRAVCADFSFQEDAQAAFRSGQTQLDGDSDGIACESLPRRPSTSTTTAGTSTSFPLALIASTGATVYITPREARLAYETLNGQGGSESSSSRLLSGGATEFSAASLSVRYIQTANSTVLGWSLKNAGALVGSGIGAPSYALASLAELAGTYYLLGQRCTTAPRLCTMEYATAQVTTSGVISVCFKAAFSVACPSMQQRALFPSSLGINIWRLGTAGENLIGNNITRSLSVGMNDGLSSVVLYGQRTDSGLIFPLPFSAAYHFPMTGVLQTVVPTFTTAIADSGKPIPGLFQNGAGNTLVRSISGQTVDWDPVDGLSLYVEP